MNSNAYLGLSFHPDVVRAEAEAAALFGTGPGAVRFISGTSRYHVALEEKLARFHGRESAMLFSAAYAAVMGVLPQLISSDTLVISDELNHNCIINAIRLSQSAKKEIYRHLEMGELEGLLQKYSGSVRRVVVVTDGIFSMRGDHAPLDRISDICRTYEGAFEEGIITVVDDSHGVGAFGRTGRGTEERTAARADLLIGTLGKAFGVNGGYVASSAAMICYLRETSPFYIYSNPITASEAAAAMASMDILDSPEGADRLERMRSLTARLEEGLQRLGYEIITGEHPIVPLMTRNTKMTKALVKHLFDSGILATGLSFPVVPRGNEAIRFQISASHTRRDIDCLLEALQKAKGQP